MKRVLVLIKGLGKGGAEQLLINAAPHLDRSSFSYEFAYVLPGKDAFAGELRGMGYPVHCLGEGRRTGWVRRLHRLATEHEIDLVHAHLPYTGVGARLGFAMGRRPRLVYTEHNVWQSYHPITYWGNLLTFHRNDFVIAVSNSVRASMRYPSALGFLDLPRTETVYHGADRASIERSATSDGVRRELNIPENALLVGTVANFKLKKGYADLVDAAARVHDVMPEVRFVLVGHGPEEERVRRRVRELGLDETIIFTGYREDAPRITAAFDIFALASHYEGLSIALVDAMTLGKPAVVTDAGGMPEVVENGNQGFVLPIGRPSEFATALISLLQDEGLRSRMGQAARQRSSLFDIRAAVRRTEDIYREVLRR